MKYVKKYLLIIFLFLIVGSVYAQELSDIDFNNDNIIDLEDILELITDFGKTSNFDQKYDVNNDNKIGIHDIVLVAKHIGETYSIVQKLNVKVFPDEIDQLETYLIEVSNPDGTPFSGRLDAQYWICPLGTTSNLDPDCNEMLTTSFDIPSTGKNVEDLSTYAINGNIIPVGKYFQQWKPSTGDYEWSDQTIISVTQLDMERYWNLISGNTYFYDLENNKMNQQSDKATRLDIISETFCGENVNSMDFSKNNLYAYWDPYYGQNTGRNFLRFRVGWLNNNLQARTWNHYRQPTLPSNLDDYPSDWYSESQLISTTYEKAYYADGSEAPPYLYSVRYLDFDDYKNDYHIVEDQGYAVFNLDSLTEQELYQKVCSEGSQAADDAGFRAVYLTTFAPDYVDTPSYIGPVARVIQREMYSAGTLGSIDCNGYADYPDNCPAGIREDWYFAKDIGLVRMEQKYFGDAYSVESEDCSSDNDCLTFNRMNNPFTVQELVSYDIEYPQEKYLIVENVNSNTKRFTLKLNRNDFEDIYFLETLNQVQLIIDNNANWDDGYGARVLLNVRDLGNYKDSNKVQGKYYVYEKELGGDNYGWQEIDISDTYNHNDGFSVEIIGLLYDGDNIYTAIEVSGFDFNNNNIYTYVEGSDGNHDVIPLFAHDTETYYGYTLSKIGEI